jgi:uncharacterized protein YndB with AHSA1/START domain
MTSMTLMRRIAARPALVFDALTTPESIAQWWGPDAGPVLDAKMDARVGGRFRVRFRMLDGSEHESSGEILELVRPQRLVLSWRWTGGQEDPGESRLSFVLREVDGGVELTLTHALLDNEETAASHTDGWSGSLDKLVRMFA